MEERENMKIVFLETDTLGSGINYQPFEQFGEVVLYAKSDIRNVEERVKDAEIVVVNKLLMNAETLRTAQNLKLICVTATGTNNIDFAYTNQKGITVTNVKGYSTATVVQHTFALYFYLMEHLPYYVNYVASGEYVKSSMFTHFGMGFHDLCGMTWGIVGLGEIGRGVAAIAKAFGCRVVYYSASGRSQDVEYERVEFNELLVQSDVISIHAPLTEKTENLFDDKAFDKMKSSACLINVGRGPIVNEEDLKDALNEGKIAGAALDVLSVEPMRADNPLLQVMEKDRLVITPHIAWASFEARKRLLEEVVLNIKAFENGEERNVVR